ncbi:polyprenyl synthetase family protein [Streptomyces sp. NPDC057011]|uniref:polyprenyl synthetase family protein n=1 Tax=unclassified Streptomyces TaxID=2593676 RepID=UPI003645A953
MTAAALPESVAAADATAIGSVVESLLIGFLDEQERTAADLAELTLFTGLLRDLLAAGGKRVRPALCVAGWRAVSDDPPPMAVWLTAASLELFHTFALIHDDIMDRSELRRGRPTAHRVLAKRLAGHRDADALGVHVAMLLGDIALGWSYELLHGADFTAAQLAAVRPVLNALRTETMIGQYLDLAASGRAAPDGAAGTAWRIIRYKTTRYTFERPLQLGALLAGASGEQLDALSAFALPMGDAFQLRDDVLGVFGDPGITGKGTLEDLREGKQTLLITTAYERAAPAQARTLRRLLGNRRLGHQDAATVRRILTETGARDAVEQLIAELGLQALTALDAPVLRPSAAAMLREIARAVSDRPA